VIREAKQAQASKELKEVRGAFGRINILLSDLNQRLEVIEALIGIDHTKQGPELEVQDAE